MKFKRRKTFDGNFLYIFWCPGCHENHTFDVREGQWTFDGDWENPTFSPSLNLIPVGGKCHLILTEGIIHFLDDCRHHLCGQSVPMVELSE
jgi:hypothetical protein